MAARLDGGPPWPFPWGTRVILVALGALVAVVLLYTVVFTFLNTRPVEDEATTLVLDLRFPDVDGEYVIAFSEADVEGLRLERATWSSRQGRRDDFVSITTGISLGDEDPEYCLTGGVVLLGDPEEPLIPAGTCLGWDNQRFDFTTSGADARSSLAGREGAETG